MLIQIIRSPHYFILFLLLLWFILFKTNNNPYKRPIDGDGKGYYAYLPATFIYQDMQFIFTEQAEKNYYPTDGSRAKDFFYETESKKVNKYFYGVGILWLPFFIVGHILAILFNFPADGYSLPYQYAISIAAIFYTSFGCFYMSRSLRRFNMNDHFIFITLIAFVFGTNLLYNTIHDPSMTHSYSFAAISFFIYSAIRFNENNKRIWIYLVAITYGIIIAIRPVNAIIVFSIPFICGSLQNFLTFIRSVLINKNVFIISILIFCAPIIIQNIFWYLQSGKWVLYSYGPEKFDFMNPQVINVLFSIRKGLFVYTPLMILPFAGLIPLYKENKFRFIIIILFIASSIYIISSWWCWWYGLCYGQRSFIDYFPIFILLTSIVVKWIEGKKIIVRIIVGIMVAFTFLNLVQTYQHKTGILPGDGITKDIYLNTFMKFKDNPNNRLDKSQNIHIATFGSETTMFSNVSKQIPFSNSIEKETKEIYKYNCIYAIAEAEIKPETDISNSLFVCSIKNDSADYFWQGHGLKEKVLSKSFNKVYFEFYLPSIKTYNDKLNIYFWNAGSEDSFVVKNFKLNLYHCTKKQ